MMQDTYGEKLSIAKKLSYGVGHVANDLTASMWFTYLLLYFHSVLGFDNSYAGYVMLLGQVADAISTPFIGYESDKTKRGICNYGRRKSWHLVGTLCVLLSFSFLFIPCITCAHAPVWSRFIYYAPFVIIFQFGWASTQISHLSLIPELTDDASERIWLNSLRYAGTVFANIVVYSIAWVLISMRTATDEAGNMNVTVADGPKFMQLGIIVSGIGLIFTFFFHIGTKEREYSTDLRNAEFSFTRSYVREMKWSDWLRDSQFYQVALIYMFARLTANLTQVYLPMYLTDSLHLRKDYIAIIPLAVYVSSFFSSFLMERADKWIGTKWTLFVGLLITGGACAWMWFPDLNLQVFGVAVLLGSGTSTVSITALSLTGQLIGRNTESSAFVYGVISFFDKLCNGVAVVIVQQFYPCSTLTCCDACSWFYRYVMVFVPGGAVVLTFVVLATIARSNIGDRDQGARVLRPMGERAGLIQSVGSSYGAIDEPVYDRSVRVPGRDDAATLPINSSSLSSSLPGLAYIPGTRGRNIQHDDDWWDPIAKSLPANA